MAANANLTEHPKKHIFACPPVRTETDIKKCYQSEDKFSSFIFAYMWKLENYFIFQNIWRGWEGEDRIYRAFALSLLVRSWPFLITEGPKSL